MSQTLTHPDSYSCLGSGLDLDCGSYCCGETETDVMAAGAYVHILKRQDVLGVGGVADVGETQMPLYQAAVESPL